MILVGQYDSPYVRRVAVSLHLLGLPFERNTISVFGDAEAMRRINPLGRIPSLILDDGEVLIDSVAILDHLDEQVGPERALLPASGRARRHALRVIAMASGAIDKAGAMVYERALRPPAKVHEPWIDRCRIQVDTVVSALDHAAAEPRPDVRIMQAEITIACMVAYLRLRAPETFPAGAYPALERVFAALDLLPAFATTRPAADEKMPDRPI